MARKKRPVGVLKSLANRNRRMILRMRRAAERLAYPAKLNGFKKYLTTHQKQVKVTLEYDEVMQERIAAARKRHDFKEARLLANASRSAHRLATILKLMREKEGHTKNLKRFQQLRRALTASPRK